MKEKKLNPFKNILVPLAQVCAFVSVLKSTKVNLTIGKHAKQHHDH
jgi:hypothetical protein